MNPPVDSGGPTYVHKICSSCRLNHRILPDVLHCPSCGKRALYIPTEDCPTTKESTRIPSEFEKLGEEIGRLVREKQAAYGDSFGKSGEVMRLLYPNGVSVANLEDALFIVRMLDKMFRIATKKDAFGENPSEDMMGYCLLHALKARKEKKG